MELLQFVFSSFWVWLGCVAVSYTHLGWKCVGQAGGLRWTGTRRPEVDLCPAQMKIRFEREETT